MLELGLGTLFRNRSHKNQWNKWLGKGLSNISYAEGLRGVMSWIMTLNTIFLCFIEILNSVKNLQAFVHLCFWPMGIQMYQEGRSHKIARKVIMLLEIPSLRSYPHWYTFLLQKLKHLGRKRKSPGKTGNLQTLLFEKQTLPSPPPHPKSIRRHARITIQKQWLIKQTQNNSTIKVFKSLVSHKPHCWKVNFRDHQFLIVWRLQLW